MLRIKITVRKKQFFDIQQHGLNKERHHVLNWSWYCITDANKQLLRNLTFCRSYFKSSILYCMWPLIKIWNICSRNYGMGILLSKMKTWLIQSAKICLNKLSSLEESTIKDSRITDKKCWVTTIWNTVKRTFSWLIQFRNLNLKYSNEGKRINLYATLCDGLVI